MIRKILTNLYILLLKALRGNIHFGDGAKFDLDVKFKKGGSFSAGINFSARSGAVFRPAGGEILFGNRCSVGEYCVIDGYGGLTIADDVHFASHVCIYTFNHNYRSRQLKITEQGMVKRPVKIGSDVWIGAHACILGGVCIGRGAVVAAGAIVAHDVNDYTIVAGVPAKCIGHRL